MRFPSKTNLFFVMVSALTLITLFLNCQESPQKVVNDGYGDYMLVPAGKFLMGDNYSDGFRNSKGTSQEQPVHPVNLDAYYIGKYVVTNGEYKKFMDDGGYTNPDYWMAEEWERASNDAEKDPTKNPGYGSVVMFSYGRHPEFWTDSTASGGEIPGNENFPVVGVNMHEANAYCKWLSEKTGETYRRPTEAEWEKAARGTDQRRFPWGDYIDRTYANYYKSSDPCENNKAALGGLTPVGYYNGTRYESSHGTAGFRTHNNASPYGAYDMAGNVFEWVTDRWDPNYYSRSPINNPTGPAPGDKIDTRRGPTYGDFIATIRGGFWRDGVGNMNMNSLRSAYRGMKFSGPRGRGVGVGFRCVREVSKKIPNDS